MSLHLIFLAEGGFFLKNKEFNKQNRGKRNKKGEEKRSFQLWIFVFSEWFEVDAALAYPCDHAGDGVSADQFDPHDFPLVQTAFL